jgi:hypothetical protein
MTFLNRFPIIAVLVAAVALTAYAGTKAELVRGAVSTDDAERAASIAGLRAAGYEGLDALLDGYAAEIAAFRADGTVGPDWPRIAFAIDSVAMQRNAYASGLYWHTDLDQALAEAKLRNRPVLSLRMLGNLNEEFSCANSRFFRALLYSDASISQYLRQNFVLHWRSVRPVPKVTIDFGDGRKLERTLTGNSIHYILSEDGELIDALAGLYDPASFKAYLQRARDFTSTLSGGARRAAAIGSYRAAIFDTVRARRTKAVGDAKVKLVETAPAGTAPLEIAPLAVTKAITEAPIIRDLDDNFSRFEPRIATDEWKRLAAANIPEVRLHNSSVAFIRRQNPSMAQPEFDRMIVELKKLVAIDSTRNEFLFHPQLLGRMNRAGAKPALEAFNSSVYNDLFRTPDSDKWLGLYSDGIYTGLDGNGVR